MTTEDHEIPYHCVEVTEADKILPLRFFPTLRISLPTSRPFPVAAEEAGGRRELLLDSAAQRYCVLSPSVDQIRSREYGAMRVFSSHS